MKQCRAFLPHLKAVVRTEEMMRGPPLAPSTARTRPSDAPTMIVGAMEDCGFLLGRMKLLGEGGRPYLRHPHVALHSMQRHLQRQSTGNQAEAHAAVRTRLPGRGWRSRPSGYSE